MFPGLVVALARQLVSCLMTSQVSLDVMAGHTGSSFRLAGDREPTRVTTFVLLAIAVEHLWLPDTEWHSLQALEVAPQDTFLMERRKKQWGECKLLASFLLRYWRSNSFSKASEYEKKIKKKNRNVFRFVMSLPRNAALLISFSSSQLQSHHYIAGINY